MKKFLQSILMMGLIVVGVFAALNFGYTKANLDYWWQKWFGGGYQAEVEDTGTPNMIYLPSLGIEAPLVYIEETGEKVFQEALANGVVHYPGTAMAGEAGNAYFFGHSSDFPTKPGNYKSVFALLPKIETGARIVITDDAGKKFVYEVFDTHVVGPNETQWLEQGERKEKLLTLQTSYPVGTALKRFLVQARLIDPA